MIGRAAPWSRPVVDIYQAVAAGLGRFWLIRG